jgi:hypothetical protein
MRRKRVALLSTELDVQRVAAQDRANSVQTKASFLVVAAGLFSASTGATAAAVPKTWASVEAAHYVPVLPILFALVTVVFCAMSLWPTAQSVVIPGKLKDEWIDSTKSDYALEVFLLQVKVDAWNDLQRVNGTRVTYLKWGFGFLVAAVAATLVNVLIHALV